MLLLDTHAAVWFALGIQLSQAARDQITQAREGDGACISAVTVWEVGNLLRKGILKFDIGLLAWVERFRATEGFHDVALSTEIVIEAANLPGSFHGDPADRFLVATARFLDMPIMTRDKGILSYANSGQVRALRC
jgi:PIN domain nuclease of toxin-antitoxin system